MIFLIKNCREMEREQENLFVLHLNEGGQGVTLRSLHCCLFCCFPHWVFPDLVIFVVVYYQTTIRVQHIFNINFIANIVIVGLVHLKLNS